MVIFAILEFIVFIFIASWLYKNSEENKKKLFVTENLARELTKENDKKRLALEEQTENYSNLSQKYDDLYDFVTEEKAKHKELLDAISEYNKAETNLRNLIDKKDAEIENLRHKYVTELKNQETSIKERTEVQMEKKHQESLREIEKKSYEVEKKYDHIISKQKLELAKLTTKIGTLEEKLTELETNYNNNQKELIKKEDHIEVLKKQLRKASADIQKMGRGAVEQAFLYNEALPNSMRRLPLFDVDNQAAVKTTTDTEVIIDEVVLVEIKNCLCDLVDLL